ncbi:hypothetical protein OPV22_004882 [Ensete ventricosum]|uniref:Uncharacterized protein n=1 Tax=Ensete ventricosum TaxID=4639 RepID=A0AAV8Q150_ENSVE|nr:hypothetical protein OPV22_004882 [Ensete ventricosum]
MRLEASLPRPFAGVLSDPSSSKMVSRVSARAARLALLLVRRHGATAEKVTFGDRGELGATSKKKEASCTLAIFA